MFELLIYPHLHQIFEKNKNFIKFFLKMWWEKTLKCFYLFFISYYENKRNMNNKVILKLRFTCFLYYFTLKHVIIEGLISLTSRDILAKKKVKLTR